MHGASRTDLQLRSSSSALRLHSGDVRRALFMIKLRTAMALMAVMGLASASYAAAPAFNELDKDHDGMLTKAECASVKNLDFAKADTNKDGRLDRAEYEAAVG
jgi:hypothetical protein